MDAVLLGNPKESRAVGKTAGGCAQAGRPGKEEKTRRQEKGRHAGVVESMTRPSVFALFRLIPVAARTGEPGRLLCPGMG
jgi:hypothetical protein